VVFAVGVGAALIEQAPSGWILEQAGDGREEDGHGPFSSFSSRDFWISGPIVAKDGVWGHRCGCSVRHLLYFFT